MIATPNLKVTIPELLIVPDMKLSAFEANELMKHAVFLSKVREESGKPLYISQRSGYRPKWYERKKGRSGNSEHATFDQEDRGATDLIYNKKQFQLIWDSDFYTRICYYPNNNFIHCDRKPIDGELQYFECESPTSKWEFQGFR